MQPPITRREMLSTSETKARTTFSPPPDSIWTLSRLSPEEDSVSDADAMMVVDSVQRVSARSGGGGLSPTCFGGGWTQSNVFRRRLDSVQREVRRRLDSVRRRTQSNACQRCRCHDDGILMSRVLRKMSFYGYGTRCWTMCTTKSGLNCPRRTTISWQNLVFLCENREKTGLILG